LARAVTDQGLDFSAPTEEVTAALAAMPGCGLWTAHYTALRALGDPDAFPVSDLVLRRVTGETGRPLTEAALEARAEEWRPWRGYAAFQLWQSVGRAVGRDRINLFQGPMPGGQPA
jgi:AraC family transcriptional regulator of adaptative response / DNA-3-methyladenine glycosylase II